AELIVAFDLPSGREALDLAARLPGLRWAKIGPVLHVREGPALVREFTTRGVRVFLDLKWHDIPSVVTGAVEAARAQGVPLATSRGSSYRACEHPATRWTIRLAPSPLRMRWAAAQRTWSWGVPSLGPPTRVGCTSG